MNDAEYFDNDHIHTTPDGRHFRHGDGVDVDANGIPLPGEPQESWRLVWGKLAPMLSTPGLEALHKALLEDDERLLQGATTQPPPLMCVKDWECEAACFIGYAGWQGDGLKTVGEVEEYFSQICGRLDNECGQEAACRYFLNWFDCDDPNAPGLTRVRVRAGLAPLVAAELDARKAVAT